MPVPPFQVGLFWNRLTQLGRSGAQPLSIASSGGPGVGPQVAVLQLSAAEGLPDDQRDQPALFELATAALTAAWGQLHSTGQVGLLQGVAPQFLHQPWRAQAVLSWTPTATPAQMGAALAWFQRNSLLPVPFRGKIVRIPIRQQPWFPQPYTAEVRVDGFPHWGAVAGASAALLEAAGYAVTADPADHSAAFVVSERLGEPLGKGGVSLAPGALTNLVYVRVRGPAHDPHLSHLAGLRMALRDVEPLRVSVTPLAGGSPALVQLPGGAAAGPAPMGPAASPPPQPTAPQQAVVGPPAAATPVAPAAPPAAEAQLAAARAAQAASHLAEQAALEQAARSWAAQQTAAAQPAAAPQPTAAQHMPGAQHGAEQPAAAAQPAVGAVPLAAAPPAAVAPPPAAVPSLAAGGRRAAAGKPTGVAKPAGVTKLTGPAKPAVVAAPKGLAGGFLRGKGGLGGSSTRPPPSPPPLSRAASTVSMRSAASSDGLAPYGEETLSQEEGMAVLEGLVARWPGLHPTEGGTSQGMPLLPLHQHLLAMRPRPEICCVPAGRLLVVGRVLHFADTWGPLLLDCPPGAPLPEPVAEYLECTALGLQAGLDRFRATLRAAPPERGRRRTPGGEAASQPRGSRPLSRRRPSPAPSGAAAAAGTGDTVLPAAPLLPAAAPGGLLPGQRSRSRSPQRGLESAQPPPAAAVYRPPHLRAPGGAAGGGPP